MADDKERARMAYQAMWSGLRLANSRAQSRAVAEVMVSHWFYECEKLLSSEPSPGTDR